MGLHEKWKQFYKNMPPRFIISNINTFINTVESYRVFHINLVVTLDLVLIAPV